MSWNCSFYEEVSRVLNLYNLYHKPEAVARILEYNESKGVIVVEFSGTFCHTCGIRDWVEDLKYLFIKLGHEAELLEYIEPGDEFRRIGVFRVQITKCSDTEELDET